MRRSVLRSVVTLAGLLVALGSTDGAATGDGPVRDAVTLAAAGPSCLPEGTKLVVRVRYSEMRGSTLFRRLAKERTFFRDETEHLHRFATEAGLDLARDVDFAWIGSGGN